MFGTFHAPLRSAAISAVVTVAGPRGRARLVLRRGCIAHVEMRAMNGRRRAHAGRRARAKPVTSPRCTMWHAARSSDIAALISTERRILSITITRAPVGRARGRAHPPRGPCQIRQGRGPGPRAHRGTGLNDTDALWPRIAARYVRRLPIVSCVSDVNSLRTRHQRVSV